MMVEVDNPMTDRVTWAVTADEWIVRTRAKANTCYEGGIIQADEGGAGLLVGGCDA